MIKETVLARRNLQFPFQQALRIAALIAALFVVPSVALAQNPPAPAPNPS
ncbi:MAG: hypothetical protein ICV68_07095, partial [Pyrinomonadaceae bacterium]|nr:hypothetical protein [Pyrinomonadaceae bacterium]